MGLVQVDGAGRAVERGVAVAEDAAVGGDEPVAVAVGRRGHADDGLAQRSPDWAGEPNEGAPPWGVDRARRAVGPVAAVRIGRHHLAAAVACCRALRRRHRRTIRRPGRHRARRNQAEQRDPSCHEADQRPATPGFPHCLPPRTRRDRAAGRQAVCLLLFRRPGELQESRSFASPPHGRFAFSFNCKDELTGVALQGAFGLATRNCRQRRVN